MRYYVGIILYENKTISIFNLIDKKINIYYNGILKIGDSQNNGEKTSSSYHYFFPIEEDKFKDMLKLSFHDIHLFDILDFVIKFSLEEKII